MKAGKFPAVLIALAVFLLAALIISAGIWFYVDQERANSYQAIQRLESIARLKSDQIATWREERYRDSRVMQDSPIFHRYVSQLLTSTYPERLEYEAIILKRLLIVTRQYDYADIMLVDIEGEPILSVTGKQEVYRHFDEALKEALAQGKPIFTQIHRGEERIAPHLAIVAPIFDQTQDVPSAIAALVLISECSSYLYPTLDSWPLPSMTAESILVTREEDEIQFLSPSRHVDDAALNLRIPGDSMALAASEIMQGNYGVSRATDYRGVDAVSVSIPIPNSDWILITKQDADELFADWRFKAGMIASLFIVLTLGTITIGIFIIMRQKTAHIERALDYESKLIESSAMFQQYMDLAGTIFLSLDTDGKVKMINKYGCEILGYEETEILGKNWFRNFIAEDQAAEFESEFETAMASNSTGTDDREIAVLTKDGESRMIRWHAVALPDKDGNPSGVLTSGEDVTEAHASRNALEQSEKEFRDLFNSTPASIMVHDKETAAVIDANPLALSTNGVRNVQELKDRGFWSQEPPYSYEDVMAYHRRAVKEGSHTFRWRNTCVEGKVLWERVVLKLIEIDGVQRVVSIAFDITDMVELEQEVDHFVELMRYIIENTNSAVAVHDLEMRYMYVSHRYLKQFGVCDKNIIGKVHYEVFPDLPEKWRDAHRRALAGEIASKDRDPFYRDDGTVDWTRWECRPWYNADGHIGGIIVYTEMITDQVRAEMQLLEQKGLLQAIYENTPALLMVVDSGAVVVQSNEFKMSNRDLSTKDALGLKVGRALKCLNATGEGRECGASEDCPSCPLRAALESTIESSETILGRMMRYHMNEDGKTIEVSLMVSSSPVEVQGQRMALMAIQDTSEKEALENQLRQSQKMDSVGMLAGGVAHDFNNMLQAIQGFAGLALEEAEESSSLYHYIEQVVKASKRSSDLTSQLLAFARRQSVAPQTLDLNKEVGKSLEMLRRLVGENIELDWKPSEKKCNVLMDRSQLNQITTNLVVNARDAIADTGTISIKTEIADRSSVQTYQEIPESDAYIRLTVSDDGCGIDPDNLEMIFEPFFSTKARGQGSGLGLSTVYGIVKQNKGFVDVDSAVGKGSTFEVLLPRQEPAESADHEDAQKGAVPKGSGETILIVEDEEPVRNLAKTILTKLNYKVISAACPKEAIELHSKHLGAIDILLTDVVMPGMNGRDMAEEIVGKDPAIKVIFMSGYSADLISNKDKSQIKINFIQKPFSREILGKKINELLTARF